MKSIIIYATKYGSAAEAAKRIQAELGGEAALCNVMKEKVPPLTDYDTVILGGSVYVGRVQKQISEYGKDHLKELLGKKVGLFLCAGEPGEGARLKELQSAFSEPLFRHAAVKEVLGYAYSFENMKFLDKLIMKKIKGDSVSTAVYFDDRIARFAQLLRSTGAETESLLR